MAGSGKSVVSSNRPKSTKRQACSFNWSTKSNQNLCGLCGLQNPAVTLTNDIVSIEEDSQANICKCFVSTVTVIDVSKEANVSDNNSANSPNISSNPESLTILQPGVNVKCPIEIYKDKTSSTVSTNISELSTDGYALSPDDKSIHYEIHCRKRISFSSEDKSPEEKSPDNSDKENIRIPQKLTEESNKHVFESDRNSEKRCSSESGKPEGSSSEYEGRESEDSLPSTEKNEFINTEESKVKSQSFKSKNLTDSADSSNKPWQQSNAKNEPINIEESKKVKSKDTISKNITVSAKPSNKPCQQPTEKNKPINIEESKKVKSKDTISKNVTASVKTSNKPWQQPTEKNEPVNIEESEKVKSKYAISRNVTVSTDPSIEPWQQTTFEFPNGNAIPVVQSWGERPSLPQPFPRHYYAPQPIPVQATNVFGRFSSPSALRSNFPMCEKAHTHSHLCLLRTFRQEQFEINQSKKERIKEWLEDIPEKDVPLELDREYLTPTEFSTVHEGEDVANYEILTDSTDKTPSSDEAQKKEIKRRRRRKPKANETRDMSKRRN